MRNTPRTSAHLEMLHETVAEELRRQVQQLPEGAKIPTEPELMDRFGVSRTTVRRAVDAMVSDGLLVRRPPKGTFVTRRSFQHALDHPGAFLDTLMASGSQLIPTLTDLRWITGDAVAEGVGDEALYFERFYTHDQRPCAVAHVYIAQPFAREISRGDLEQAASYEVFTTKLGVTVDHTDATINVINADTGLAKRLGLDAGTSVIVLHRRMYTDHDQLLQYSRHYLPAHQFELSLTHTGHRAAGQNRPAAVLRLLTPPEHSPTTEPASSHPERNLTA